MLEIKRLETGDDESALVSSILLVLDRVILTNDLVRCSPNKQLDLINLCLPLRRRGFYPPQ